MIERAISIANHFMSKGLDTKVAFNKDHVGDVWAVVIRITPDRTYSADDIISEMQALSLDNDYIEVAEYDVSYVIV